MKRLGSVGSARERHGLFRCGPSSRKLVVRDTVLNVQVPLSGGYDFAREVSAPERPVRRFGDNPRTGIEPGAGG
jgi:hypothetical protein